MAKKEQYLRARAIVSGRFVNGYAGNDWILGKCLPPSSVPSPPSVSLCH